MKNSLKMLLAASAIFGAGFVATAPASAQTGFSFRVGDVAIGYSDGYYDRRNRWHSWRNAREHEWYRVNYRDNYRGYRRDQDRDGIPNRFDRDRDGDGIPNRVDRRPNIPSGFSFRTGDVVFGFQDGYYDRSNQWRPWRNAREREWYRVNYRDNYRGYRRDQDRDGIRDRYDRDRDGDGVPNRVDRRPNNPYR